MNLTQPEGPAPLNLSRRSFGLATVFAGYAAAVSPVNAAAITTDSEGLVTGMVKYPSQGFDLPAYVARPKSPGRKPVIIVASEIFGLHAYIQDVCRRLAKQGYVAIAPAFFVRVADPAPLTDFTEIRKIVSQATNKQVMGDIDATISWLDKQAFASRSKIGITGYCWGGAVTWMAVAHSKRIKAGVAWYGRLVSSPPQPGAPPPEDRKWPADVAIDLNGPVLGLYAENDQGIPLSSVDTMRAALKAAGKDNSEIRVYPGAQHGFHADYRPQYKADAAHDGWTRLLSWFARAGVV